jgi:hypothetical protein
LLSCVFRRLPTDWRRLYGVDPYLVETLVDRELFYGGCYRAGNFIVLGETAAGDAWTVAISVMERR